MRRQLRRALACLTLVAALAGLTAAPASAAGFRDVPAGHWAAESIQRCVSLGFFQGKSADRFGVGEEMTRSAFAVVLCRFFGWETPKPETATFQDVPVTAWYAGAVEAAYDHGAFTGQREDFRPQDPVTREELAVALVRAMGYGTIAGLTQDPPFGDVHTNAGYITMACDLGLMGGTSDTAFSPDRTAPREQVAVILMRLYDKLHSPAPALLAAPASADADLTGLDGVLIPGGQLLGVGGKPSINGQKDTAVQLRTAAQIAGAQAILYIQGGLSTLDANARETAELLVQTVQAGDYDGLLLDIPELKREKKKAMTQLVKALDSALGDLPLYLTVEAPSLNGKRYEGYDYEALAALTDRLVLRVPSYEAEGEGFPAAPVNPLEEVYYALDALRDHSDKLVLMLDTAPSVWDERGRRRTLAEEELAALLESGEQHYSNRYACAYVTGVDEDEETLAAWYLDRQAVTERIRLAQAFGVDQICLTEWDDGVRALVTDAQTGTE